MTTATAGRVAPLFTFAALCGRVIGKPARKSAPPTARRPPPTAAATQAARTTAHRRASSPAVDMQALGRLTVDRACMSRDRSIAALGTLAGTRSSIFPTLNDLHTGGVHDVFVNVARDRADLALIVDQRLKILDAVIGAI